MNTDFSIENDCIIQLDHVVEQLTQSSKSQQIYRTKYLVYTTFLQKLKKRQRQQGGLSQQISKMEQILKQKLFEDMQKFQKTERIRGRPIKNSQAQKKLGQWIREQERVQFTRKQIKDKYCQYLGKKMKCLPMSNLIRILDRCGIYGLEIQSRVIGKNKNSVTIVNALQNKIEQKQQQYCNQLRPRSTQQLFHDNKITEQGYKNDHKNDHQHQKRHINQSDEQLEQQNGKNNDGILSWDDHFSGDDSILRFMNDGHYWKLTDLSPNSHEEENDKSNQNDNQSQDIGVRSPIREIQKQNKREFKQVRHQFQNFDQDLQ